MSQVYKLQASIAPLPPAVPTQFNTQDGNAVPSGNILIVNGEDSTENNANGIITKGGVVGTGTSNEVDVVLTNRVNGSASTVGAVTSTIITFTPTVIGTYAFEFRIAAYNTTSSLGSGASVFGAIRFDGVNTNICDLFDEINNDEGAMTGTDIAVISSGADMLLQATGYLGQTINWSAVGLYTFVGA
jgi:hypothetical protein